MSTAMAPFAPIKECIILVWEGGLGAFYHWNNHGQRISRIDVMSEPGARFSSLFALAHPDFPATGDEPHHDFPGKLMALAAYGSPDPVASDRTVIDDILTVETVYPFNKAKYYGTHLFNCGTGDPRLHSAARYMTDRLFDIFLQAAHFSLPRNVPLVISGGCGLNFEWNRRWMECGLFTEVFVPPCTNDSGSAIGTAVDAMVYFGAPARLEWSVFAGEPFIDDASPDPGLWHEQKMDLDSLARVIEEGAVVAWIEGRCELGPQALGHRSLLASPVRPESRQLLNAVKGREDYRPIAPCCLSEDLGLWFNEPIDDPYMLYFSTVRTASLPAVTHIDGTARVQSVRRADDLMLYDLLQAFRRVSGCGMLCNTSLNFRGRGFINRTSDVFLYCEPNGIQNVVIEGRWYRHRGSLGEGAAPPSD